MIFPLNYWRKKHLAKELRSRGHHQEAQIVEETDHDILDYHHGVSNGLKYAMMMDNFVPPTDKDVASEQSVADAEPQYQGEGGEFGGGGAGGDYDAPELNNNSGSESSDNSSSYESSSSNDSSSDYSSSDSSSYDSSSSDSSSSDF